MVKDISAYLSEIQSYLTLRGIGILEQWLSEDAFVGGLTLAEDSEMGVTFDFAKGTASLTVDQINEDNTPGAEELARIRIQGSAPEDGEPIARMVFETIG